MRMKKCCKVFRFGESYRLRVNRARQSECSLGCKVRREEEEGEFENNVFDKEIRDRKQTSIENNGVNHESIPTRCGFNCVLHESIVANLPNADF